MLNDIADELGDLPLALHLAGSFLRTVRYSKLGDPVEYLAALQKSKLDHPSLIEEIDGYSPTKHDLNIARTFQYSYDQLKNDDEIDTIAIRLLKRTAFFACGEPIPRDLLKACLRNEKDRNELKLEKGIKRLINLGLLTESQTGDLTLHRLIGLFVHKVDTDLQAQSDIEETILEKSINLSTQGYIDPILSLYPHFKAITDNAMQRDDNLAASLCHYLCRHLEHMGRLKLAIIYCQRALEIDEKILGPNDLATASNLINLGYLFTYIRDHKQALSYHQRALSIKKKHFGSNDPKLTSSLINLGFLYKSMEDSQQAFFYYNQALEINEKVSGSEGSDISLILGNLLSLCNATGNIQQSIYYASRILKINEKILESNSLNDTLCLNNLGGLFVSLGNYQQALPYYHRALNICKAKLGVNHPHTQLVQGNLETLRTKMDTIKEQQTPPKTD